MAGPKLQAPRGTFDVLPEDGERRAALRESSDELLGMAGYAPFDTPVFEDPAAHGYYREEGGGMMVGLFEPQAAPWKVEGVPRDFSFGTLPDDMTRANMHAIAEEILPHFRNRLPQGKKQAAAE